MRRFQTPIRLQKWQVDEAQKRLAGLVRLEDSLRRDRVKLEEELAQEQATAAGSADAQTTYGAYAAQVIVRRSRLDQSIEDIAIEVAQARDVLRAAFDDLKKFEQAAAAAERRTRERASHRERIQQDETALEMFRRGASVSA